MRFILTNDDGIYARGLSALYQELSKDAECIVVAPEIEQSAVGHAIPIARPLMVRKAGRHGNFLGPAVPVSLDTHKEAAFTAAARFARRMAAFILEHPLPHVALNVNVPAIPEEEIRGVVVAKQGHARLRGGFD